MLIVINNTLMFHILDPDHVLNREQYLKETLVPLHLINVSVGITINSVLKPLNANLLANLHQLQVNQDRDLQTIFRKTSSSNY